MLHFSTSPQLERPALSRPPGRRVSIGQKLAIGTVGVVSLVCACAYFALTAHEYTSLFRSKELAASMVTKLFSSSLGAVVQFSDQQGLTDSLAQLQQNHDIDAAAVFKLAPGGKGELLGGFARNNAQTIGQLPSLQPGGAQRHEGRLLFVEDVRDPQGAALGRVVAAFSLAREEATFTRLKRNILLSSGAAALLLVVVLMVLARRIVVRPLSELGRAVRALEGGTTVDIAIHTRDEVGDVSRAFGSMAAAISDREQRIARRNRDLRLVLDNVAQGFFVVDAKGVLVGERSAILNTWFGEPRPGQRFWSYLSSADPAKCQWIEALWGTLADDFLPLDMALQQFPSRLSSDLRHLEIEYRPILDNGVATQFVVVLTDVSAAVEHELAEREQRQLLELFKRFIASRTVFADFIKEAAALASYIADPANTNAVMVTRALHTLKGNAGSFGITVLAELCHKLESRIIEGAEMPTSAERAELLRIWMGVQTAAEQLSHSRRKDTVELSFAEYNDFRSAVARNASRETLLSEVDRWRLVPTSQRLEALAECATALAARLHKAPITVITEDHGVRLPSDGWSAFWNSLVHVIRNAVDHGLEPAKEREAAGKVARITISTAYCDGGVVVCVGDNGRGIAWDKVAKRASEMGIASATKADLEAALFADGVTTRDVASDISGRGVGMAAVREAVLDAGGRIEVDSTLGQGTTFRFTFPARPFPAAVPLHGTLGLTA